MIRTLHPYGAININVIRYLFKTPNKFYLVDGYGRWQIKEEEYEYLKNRGFETYERGVMQ